MPRTIIVAKSKRRCRACKTWVDVQELTIGPTGWPGEAQHLVICTECFGDLGDAVRYMALSDEDRMEKELQ